MKKKELFTCEYCHTDYADKERAQQCEKNHKKDTEECIAVYKPYKSIEDGAPVKIIIKYKGVDKYIEYHR
jgi:hypothetical protein